MTDTNGDNELTEQVEELLVRRITADELQEDLKLMKPLLDTAKLYLSQYTKHKMNKQYVDAGGYAASLEPACAALGRYAIKYNVRPAGGWAMSTEQLVTFLVSLHRAMTEALRLHRVAEREVREQEDDV